MPGVGPPGRGDEATSARVRTAHHTLVRQGPEDTRTLRGSAGPRSPQGKAGTRVPEAQLAGDSTVQRGGGVWAGRASGPERGRTPFWILSDGGLSHQPPGSSLTDKDADPSSSRTQTAS